MLAAKWLYSCSEWAFRLSLPLAFAPALRSPNANPNSKLESSQMKSSGSLCLRVLGLAGLLLLWCGSQVNAQQPAAGRKRVPSLNTDDVRIPVDTGSDAQGGEPDAKAAKAQAADDKVSPEESRWRERVAQARDKAKS